MKKNNWKNKPVMICGKQYEINAIGTWVWTGETWVEVKEDSENDRYIEIGGDVLYFDPEPQDTTLAPIEEDTELNVTPGEWKPYMAPGKKFSLDGWYIQCGKGTLAILYGNTPDQTHANAYLIAQAKNLFRDLKELYSTIDSAIELTPELLQRCATTLKNCKPKT